MNNLGDEAVRIGLARLLRQCQYSLVSYPRTGRKPAYRPIELTSAYFEIGVLAGGTLINLSGEWLDRAEESLRICRKFLILGTGVADPTFWSTRGNWRSTLAKWQHVFESAAYVGLRGPRSMELVANTGFERAEVFGDPVFALSRSTNQYLNTHSSHTLGLNIGWSNGGSGADDQQVQREIAGFARVASMKGWRVKWFIVNPTDKASTIDAAIASGTADEIVECFTSPAEYARHLSGVGIFVGMRLHAVALAICNFVPSLMIEYRPKCKDFMKSVESEHLGIPIGNLDQNHLMDELEDLDKNAKEESLRLHRIVTALRLRQEAIVRRELCL